MTTIIRTRIRTLATAAVLALAVVSVSAGHAHAKPRTPNAGPHCAIPSVGPGYVRLGSDRADWVFYTPGDLAEVQTSDGRISTLKCGANGRWSLTNY